jgi:hypothetical protein
MKKTQRVKELSSFRLAFGELIGRRKGNAVFAARRGSGGPLPRLPGYDLAASLVYHVMQGCGTLGAHVQELTGQAISESALSARRQGLPWAVFEELLRLALRPLAKPQAQGRAFYKGLRLVGIDGSSFSLSNTPQSLARLSKAASRRLRAAFIKLRVVVLMELGLHNPLAAAIGRDGESEMALARRLFDRLQPGWLALMDRLYGVGVVVAELWRLHTERGVEFLVRVRGNLKAVVREVLRDGSVIVEVRVKKQRLRLRQITGRVRRRNGVWVTVRLWTSLLDATKYPALELLGLYAQRWELEIGYKELKVELRGGELLNSHTVETAAQEVAALLLAQAVLVRVRQTAGTATEVLRISFAKTLHLVRGLWMIMQAGADLLKPRQAELLVKRLLKHLAEQVSGKRRARSCPRAVRQPVQSWPRLLKNTYETGAFQYDIIRSTI